MKKGMMSNKVLAMLTAILLMVAIIVFAYPAIKKTVSGIFGITDDYTDISEEEKQDIITDFVEEYGIRYCRAANPFYGDEEIAVIEEARINRQLLCCRITLEGNEEYGLPRESIFYMVTDRRNIEDCFLCLELTHREEWELTEYIDSMPLTYCDSHFEKEMAELAI